MALYTFARILSELVKVTLHLPAALPVFHLTPLTLLIIYTLLLSTMKWYISLYNRVILTKTRKTSFTSQSDNIKMANLNLKINIIINLITHLGFLLKYFFNTKNLLYMIKKVVGLQITHNISVMTQRSVLVTCFQNIKIDLIIYVICKTI